MIKWPTKLLILGIVNWVLLFSGTAGAADATSAEKGHTLQSLYQIALEQAEQIGIAEENLAIAENLRVQAKSVLVPRLSGFGSYTKYTEEKNVFGNIIQPDWKGAYGLRVGQSFTMNGREIDALRVAERGIDKSRADLSDVKERYLFSVAQAFFDVAKSRQGVAIAEANVQRLETHRDAVTSRLKLGDLAVTELYRTEAELSDAQAGLIQAKNNLQLNRALLGSLVGNKQPIDIVEEPNPVLAEFIADLDRLKETALANRADLKSLNFQEAIAEHQIDYYKGAYWPRFGVEAAWMRMVQDPDPALDESIYIGLNVEMDIFDAGLRRAQVSDARRQRHQAELARQNFERTVLVETEQVWLFWKTQQEAARSYESQLKYAKENYDAVKRLNEHGMANVVEVIDANTLLVTAQLQLSDARYNVQIAELGVERASGTFLNRIKEDLDVENGKTPTEKP
jgi:outer membrane protein